MRFLKLMEVLVRYFQLQEITKRLLAMNVEGVMNGKKVNKFIYETIIQGFWCGRWSDECAGRFVTEMKRTLKEYRDNCPGVSFQSFTAGHLILSTVLKDRHTQHE